MVLKAVQVPRYVQAHGTGAGIGTGHFEAKLTNAVTVECDPLTRMPNSRARKPVSRCRCVRRGKPARIDAGTSGEWIYWVTMGRNTGNILVIERLQDALTEFLDDHRNFALSDPEWCEGFAEMSVEEREQTPGCGCTDCLLAGELRGKI
jgi:hypothetical protein